jgi:hypothetical protein
MDAGRNESHVAIDPQSLDPTNIHVEPYRRDLRYSNTL